jgi:YgiT-type zinc finger domain-containing protein
MYGYKCEYCSGTVKLRLIDKEVFKHKAGFVMLEDVPVGVCDTCGYRYYHSSILKKVDDIARGKQHPERTESVPVALFSQHSYGQGIVEHN